MRGGWIVLLIGSILAVVLPPVAIFLAIVYVSLAIYDSSKSRKLWKCLIETGGDNVPSINSIYDHLHDALVNRDLNEVNKVLEDVKRSEEFIAKVREEPLVKVLCVQRSSTHYILNYCSRELEGLARASYLNEVNERR